MATDSSGKYFISYTHTEIDSKWAEWIAWQLESAGHEVILDKWDFQSGQNFPLQMHQAIIDSKKIIAILSREYSANRSHAANEWTSAYNSKKLLIIQIEQLDESELGLLSPIKRINLTNFISKNDARKHLLKNIDPTEDGRREKSDEEPPFPGDLSEKSDTNDVQKTIANGISREELNHYEFKAGLVDKDQQAGHIIRATRNNFFISNTDISPLAFFMYGESTQWPKALLFVLYTEIKRTLNPTEETINKFPESEDKTLTRKIYYYTDAEHYLLQLLAGELLPSLKTQTNNYEVSPIRENVIDVLANYPAPLILYRVLNTHESENPELVCNVLEAWERLNLPENSPRHILILFYSQLGQRKKDNLLIEGIRKFLLIKNKESFFLPEISSPTKRHVNEWVNIYGYVIVNCWSLRKNTNYHL